ncbi:MAG: hypothetical protein HDT24_06590 [Ruminococcus sp.]|nr:hypothetical protein [Ruminococcus sp.]
MFAPPRNAFAFLTSCSVSGRKGISPPAGGDQGLCPVDLATFEKVDETFPWRLRRLKVLSDDA